MKHGFRGVTRIETFRREVRAALRRGEKPSLRGVSRTMKLSQNAIYRYYLGIEDLLTDVAGRILAEGEAIVTEAKEPAKAYRIWAEQNPEEFWFALQRDPNPERFVKLCGSGWYAEHGKAVLAACEARKRKRQA